MNHRHTVALGSDHAAFELKSVLFSHVKTLGYEVKDAGAYGSEPVDYPDIAVAAVKLILTGEARFGILLCGTGIGMSIAANRFPGVRAAVCHDEFTARMSRLHNNANIICIGGRNTGAEAAKVMVSAWLATDFEGGRHIARLDKIEKAAFEEWRKKIDCGVY